MTHSGITEKAGALIQLIQSQKPVVEQYLYRPQRLLFLLDMAPPWVSKKILSLASGVLDPHMLAKGLTVEEWSSTRVGLSLPDRWINRLGAGGPSKNLTNAFSMAQMALRLYWEWQVGIEGDPIEIRQLNWESLQNGTGGLKARYQVNASSRDEWLFYLQKDGEVELEAEVLILDHRELIVGAVRGSIVLRGPKYLP